MPVFVVDDSAADDRRIIHTAAHGRSRRLDIGNRLRRTSQDRVSRLTRISIGIPWFDAGKPVLGMHAAVNRSAQNTGLIPAEAARAQLPER